MEVIKDLFVVFFKLIILIGSGMAAYYFFKKR